VAPKQKHFSIVTVIDLDKEWECPSCEWEGRIVNLRLPRAWQTL
jgi:hypothetical protein